jgi:hypothetical protein
VYLSNKNIHPHKPANANRYIIKQCPRLRLSLARRRQLLSGQAAHGALNYLYHIAIDASLDTRLMLFGENNAVFGGNFTG